MSYESGAAVEMQVEDDAADVRILQELAYLRDLFERRLTEDTTKNRAFDELYQLLQFARDGLTTQVLLPVINDVLLACDRLESSSDKSNTRSHTAEELIAIFERYGLREIEWEGRFDPSRHEVLKTLQVQSESQDGTNIELLRRGYTLGNIMVRSAGVAVGTYVPPISFDVAITNQAED